VLHRITNVAYDIEVNQKIDIDRHGLGIVQEVGKWNHNHDTCVSIVYHYSGIGKGKVDYWIPRHKVMNGERYSGATLVEEEN
jgi:hypothetical protein